MTALADWPARHAAQAFLILVALVLLGGALAARLALERLPSSPGAMLRVQVELPGVDAAQVEAIVTRPIEDALASLPDVQETVSRSRDGRATIELRFSRLADREAAVENVRQLLTRVSS